MAVGSIRRLRYRRRGGGHGRVRRLQNCRLAADADPNHRRGKKAMTALINSIRRAVPAGLEEIVQRGSGIER
jgi:hypothetical protein